MTLSHFISMKFFIQLLFFISFFINFLSVPVFADSPIKTNLDDIQKATAYADQALKNAESAKAEFERAMSFINQLKKNCKAFSKSCNTLEPELKRLNNTLVKTNKEFDDIRNKVVKAIGTVNLVANRANLMLTTYESVSNPDSMTSYIAGLHTLATTTVEIGKEITSLTQVSNQLTNCNPVNSF